MWNNLSIKELTRRPAWTNSKRQSRNGTPPRNEVERRSAVFSSPAGSIFGGVGLVFNYTGTGVAIPIGTPGAVAQAGKVGFQNFQLDLRSAGLSAIGVDTYGVNQFGWDGFCVAGTGANSTTSNTQIGIRMNANAGGEGEAGQISNTCVTGTNIGLQLNSVTYKTFTGLSINALPGWVGATAFDCNGCAAISVIGGVTNNNYASAYSFRGGASVNFVVSGTESSTNAAVFDNTTSQNTAISINGGNFHNPSNAGTNNPFMHGGTILSSRNQGGSNAGFVQGGRVWMFAHYLVSAFL